MMKRILLISFVLTSISAVFFGCGGSGTPIPSKGVKSAQIIFSAMTTPVGFTPVLANISSVRFPDTVTFPVNSDGSIQSPPPGLTTARFDIASHILNFAYADSNGLNFGQAATLTMSLTDSSITEATLLNSIIQLNQGKFVEFTGGFNAMSSAHVPVRIEVKMN